MSTTAPTFDARNTIPARLDRLEMPQWFFAELCGSNKAEFSRLMNSQKNLSGTKTEYFYQILDAVEELTDLFKPCPIKWSDVEVIRDLISSPNLPNLMSLLCVQGVMYLQHMMKLQLDCQRIESEIAALQEKTRKEFLAWLENPQTTGRGI